MDFRSGPSAWGLALVAFYFLGLYTLVKALS